MSLMIGGRCAGVVVFSNPHAIGRFRIPCINDKVLRQKPVSYDIQYVEKGLGIGIFVGNVGVHDYPMPVFRYKLHIVSCNETLVLILQYYAVLVRPTVRIPPQLGQLCRSERILLQLMGRQFLLLIA